MIVIEVPRGRKYRHVTEMVSLMGGGMVML